MDKRLFIKPSNHQQQASLERHFPAGIGICS